MINRKLEDIRKNNKKNGNQFLDTTDSNPGISEDLRLIILAAVFLIGLVAGAVYLNNASSFFAYIILMPIYLVFFLIPPFCFFSVPGYFILGFTIYKWIKTGKVIWLVMITVIIIPSLIYVLHCIDCSMGI